MQPLFDLVSSSNLELNRVRNTFETTPKISTYLVAFAVCDYVSVSYPRGHIYIRASYKDHANFTASVVNSIIETTEDYLKVKLLVSKLDIIFVRQMYNVDGMENVGLIVLLERSGLYKEGQNTLEEKYDTFILTIHEIVHHWFGDLVTCDWWNNLWLKEGVTALLESRIAAKVLFQNKLISSYMLIMIVDYATLEIKRASYYLFAETCC